MANIKIKSLDGIRFILALLVVIGHFYTLIGGIKLYKFNPVIEAILYSPIKAVYGFMLITGFLMMHNYVLRAAKENVNNKITYYIFWMRRFFRLYPLYFIVLLIAYFSYEYIAKIGENNLIHFTGSNITQWGFVRETSQPSLIDFITHIFLIHGLFPEYHDSILGVAWSLSLEMQFYMIFPFLFTFLFDKQSLRKTRLILLVLLSSYLSFKFDTFFNTINNLFALEWWFKVPSFLIVTFPVFLLGMIMAGVKHKIINVRFLFISLYLVLTTQTGFTNLILISILIFIFLPELKFVLPKFIYKLLYNIDNILSSKLAEYGANISYSLYLIHSILISLIINLLIQFIKPSNNDITSTVGISFFITIIACAILCTILYYYIEKPFIEYGKKYIDKYKTTFMKNNS